LVEEILNLHALLKKKLFLENIQACYHKKELEYYVRPTEVNEALHKNFIRFGTKKATSFLIIDIDEVSQEHYQDIELYSSYVKLLLNLTPNWISRTTKGYHIGFLLEEPVWLNNHTLQNRLSNTKKYITHILGGDEAGSLRLIGYWRNPLTHDSIINTKKIYSIDDLSNEIFRLIIGTPKFNIDKISEDKRKILNINIDKVDKNRFVEGNRNNFLFKKVVAMLYNGDISNHQVEDTLISINGGELDLQEISRISKSIQKYNIQPNNKQKREPYKRGPYHKALWDNGIHNYIKDTKVEFSRQKMGQKITTCKIIESTILKLVNGYIKTYQNRETFTNKNIEKNSNVSKSTIKRYRNQRKLEDNIKWVAFKRYIKILVGAKSVKANEPLLSNLINLAIYKISFEYKIADKVFAFYKNIKNRLLFYEFRGEWARVAA